MNILESARGLFRPKPKLREADKVEINFLPAGSRLCGLDPERFIVPRDEQGGVQFYVSTDAVPDPERDKVLPTIYVADIQAVIVEGGTISIAVHKK